MNYKAVLDINVYHQMIASLSILALLGVFYYDAGLSALFNILGCIVFTGILDVIGKYLKMKRIIFPKTGMISGMLIGGILSPTSSIAQLALACLMAMLSKHAVRLWNRNVFNPATFGILSSIVVLGASPAWWIASNAYAVAILGFLILAKLSKYSVFISFLLAMLVALVLTGVASANLVNIITTQFIIFFAMFMLTEPRTSAYKDLGVILYGGIVGLISGALFLAMPSAFLFIALLTGNVASLALNKLKV